MMQVWFKKLPPPESLTRVFQKDPYNRQRVIDISKKDGLLVFNRNPITG